MSIYSTKLNINEPNENYDFIVLEFVTDGDECFILTDEDCTVTYEEVLDIISEDVRDNGTGGYPSITIKYNNNRYVLNIIPQNMFIGCHRATRVKYLRPSNRDDVLGYRYFMLDDTDNMKRGIVRIPKNNMKDKKDLTNDAKEAGMSFILDQIDALVLFIDGYISRDEFEERVDEYNNKPQRIKTARAREAKRLGAE